MVKEDKRSENGWAKVLQSWCRRRVMAYPRTGSLEKNIHLFGAFYNSEYADKFHLFRLLQLRTKKQSKKKNDNNIEQKHMTKN